MPKIEIHITVDTETGSITLHSHDSVQENITVPIVPAYIRMKYKGKCASCSQSVDENTLAFWDGKNKKVWHSQCGKEEWKASGTPFAMRKQAAMKHQQEEADKAEKGELGSL